MSAINFLKNKSNLGVISAAKWSLIGQFTQRILNLSLTIILARIFLPEEYGKFYYLIGTLAFMVQLIGLSIRSISIRNVSFLFSKNIESCQKYIYSSLFIGLSLSLFGLVFLNILMTFFSESYIVNDYGLQLLIFVSLAIISEIYYGLTLGILEGLQLFKNLNLLTIIIVFLKFTFTILASYFYGLNIGLIAWVSASLMGVIITLLFLKRALLLKHLNIKVINIKECKSEIKLFIKYSLPSTIELSVLLLIMWLIKTNIYSTGETGKAKIAAFNIATQWKSLAIYIPAIFINMLQSFFSSSYGSNDSGKIKYLYKNVKKFTVTLSIIITITTLIFSDYIILIFGRGYNEASFILSILIAPTILLTVNSLNRQLLISMGKVKFIALNNSFCALLMFSFYFLLVYFDIDILVSFSISIVINEVMVYLINFIYIKKFKLINNL
jgi:O-antigen/teichoic acid export membrane protein